MTDDEENWWIDAGYNDFHRGFEEVSTIGFMDEERQLQLEAWRSGWIQAQNEQKAIRLLLVAGLAAAVGLLLWYVGR